MKSEQIQLLVANGTSVEKVHALKGGVVRLKAVRGARYVLSDKSSGFAPENITVKRVGKDLQVFLEGSEGQEPDLVLVDYFESDCSLIGMAEDGAYYHYVPSDGDYTLLYGEMADGASAAYALGGENLGIGALVMVAAAGLGALGIAAAALGGAAVVGGVIKDDGKGKPPVEPTDKVGNKGIGGVLDNHGPETGPISNGGHTDDNTPTLSGGGLNPGDTVILKDNGKEIGRVEVDPEGNWTFTPEEPLGEGDHSITIIVKDKNGNESEPSDPHEITVDTKPPVKPDGGNATDNEGSITGLIPEGGTTDDTTPTLSGGGLEPGDTVILKDGDKEIGRVEVDPEGNWTFTPDEPLAEGQHDIKIVVKDKAGNESEPSDPQIIIVDTTPPDSSAIGDVFDNQGTLTGSVSNDGHTDDNTPTLSGEGLEPGETVIVKDNGKEIGRAEVGPDGTWTFTPSPALPEGEHVLNIEVQDKAGNVSEPSDDYVIVVDTTAPDKPVIGDVQDNNPDVTGSISDGGHTDDTTPTLSGKGLKPGETVIVKDGGQLLGTTTVDGNGNWSFTPETPLAEGEHSLAIEVQDKAGNISVPSDEHVIVVDTTAPDQPVIGDAQDNNPGVTGSIPDGGTTDDTTPTLSGSGLEPGDTVILKDGDEEIGRVEVDPEGNWTFTPDEPLAEGEHDITIVVKDKAGNESEPSDEYVIVVDTTPTDKPAITGLLDDAGASTGNVVPGGKTDDATPTLSGTAEAGSIVMVYDGTNVLGSTTADAAGTWSFTPELPMGEGLHDLTVKALDPAGNLSEASDSYPVEIGSPDAPAVPAITSIHDNAGAVQGGIQKDGVTDDVRPELKGTAEAGSIVRIYDGAKELGSTTADASGNWSFTPATDLAPGKHDFTANATNELGNSSPKTGVWSIVVDTTAPTTTAQLMDNQGAVTGAIVNGTVTDDATPTYSGKASEGNGTAVIYDNGVEIGRVPTDANGNWSFTPTTDLSQGPHNLSAEVTDVAGNTGPKSTPYPITIQDTSKPDVPVIVEVIDDFRLVQGKVDPNETTDDARPELKGTAEAGSTVTIYVNGARIDEVKADASGNWSYLLEVDLSSGNHVFTVDARDAAGNTSEKSAPYHITVDTSPPAAPIINQVLDNVGTHAVLEDGDITDDTTPTFVGTAEGNGTVEIWAQMGTVLLGSTQVDADGNWSFTPPVPMAEGFDMVMGIAIDQWGNRSELSTAWSIDIVSPTARGAKAHGEPASTELIDGLVIDGQGEGLSTLKLTGADTVLDLSSYRELLAGVEVVDIRGTGSNTLKLSVEDVLAQGGKDLFHDSGDVQLMVKGDADDRVTLDEVMGQAGDWAQGGDVTVEGVTYATYQHTGLEAELLVQQGVSVHLV